MTEILKNGTYDTKLLIREGGQGDRLLNNLEHYDIVKIPRIK